MFPVFCIDCRRQVSRKVSRAGNGLCGDCFRKMLGSALVEPPVKVVVKVRRWVIQHLRIYGPSAALRSVLICSVGTTFLFWPAHGAQNAMPQTTPAQALMSGPAIPKPNNRPSVVPWTPPTAAPAPAFANDPDTIRIRGQMFEFIRGQVVAKVGDLYPEKDISFASQNGNPSTDGTRATVWTIDGAIQDQYHPRHWQAKFMASTDGQAVDWTFEVPNEGVAETYSFPKPSFWIW